MFLYSFPSNRKRQPLSHWSYCWRISVFDDLSICIPYSSPSNSIQRDRLVLTRHTHTMYLHSISSHSNLFFQPECLIKHLLFTLTNVRGVVLSNSPLIDWVKIFLVSLPKEENIQAIEETVSFLHIFPK